MQTAPLIVWFKDVDLEDPSTVGKEGKKLGSLAQGGFPIAPGFIITSSAYFQFLKENKLDFKIKKLLTTINYEAPESVMQVTNHIKKLFFDASFSDTFVENLQSYQKKMNAFPLTIHAYSLTKDNPKHVSHKAHHPDELIAKVKNAWAEHFSGNLLVHREQHTIDHFDTGTAIVIQMEIKPEKEGIVITIDPHSHAKDRLHVLHNLTHGTDHYELSKKNLSILERHLVHHEKHLPKLTHEELLQIGDIAQAVEKHHFFPQEIHWGIIGDKCYVLRVSPYTELPKAKHEKVKKHSLARGFGITKTIGSGVVHIIHEPEDFTYLKAHHIVVLEEIKPEHIARLKKVRGVIAEKGEKHSATNVLLREHAIPTLIDVKFAKKGLRNGQIITIHAGKGEIYKGGF